MSWLRTNDTTDMPNFADTANAYTNARSAEVDKVDQSNQLMETLRNEHTRVFMQDQALLKTIKDKPAT